MVWHRLAITISIHKTKILYQQVPIIAPPAGGKRQLNVNKHFPQIFSLQIFIFCDYGSNYLDYILEQYP